LSWALVGRSGNGRIMPGPSSRSTTLIPRTVYRHSRKRQTVYRLP
jgi:hypothetical protein